MQLTWFCCLLDLTLLSLFHGTVIFHWAVKKLSDLFLKPSFHVPFPFFAGVFSNDSQNGSKWPIWMTWKVLYAIGNLFPSLSIFVVLPDIRVSSFSFSCPLLRSFNAQGSKHNNLAKESGPLCNIKQSVLPRILQFSFFLWELHVNVLPTN